jgi:hypothetical protein
VDKYGLRGAVVAGCLLNFVGAWMRYVGSTDPNWFTLVFVGQVFCAISQCFLLFVPARLATVWYPENEQSTATGVGQAAKCVYHVSSPMRSSTH